jgi:exopolysaccharide biosynthesis polyprenyl glycosylphosphotransferase
MGAGRKTLNMPKPIEKLLLLFTDFITINLAFFGLLRLRSSFDLFVTQGFSEQLLISFIIYFMWAIIFAFVGLYQSWYTQSRFDELISVFKAVTFGILFLFVLTFEPEQDLSKPPTFGRLLILSYYFLMLIFVGSGRLILHTIQRKLLEAGVGQRNTLIIGWNNNARKLAQKIIKFPALGYRLIGFVCLEQKSAMDNLDILGCLDQLPEIVHKYQVEEVIISLGRMPQKKVLGIIAKCEDAPVNIKIEPDLYYIVMGQAKTQQIYGFPLIEIQPQLLTPWERKTKRLLDIGFAFLVLILFLPIFVLVGFLIKIDSPGPVFFTQKRVGRNGKIFTIYKFRTMVKNAEKLTGPTWAGAKDPRITRIGRLLRKTRLDEFPQLINVLVGDMSLVGPRPERPYFVDRLKREYPFYTRRLKVQPGITGWAQVKGKYDTTIEDVKEKLEYDLYYIENISLRMDFRILFYTISVMLRFKGQ